MNLCSSNESKAEISVISAVFGFFLVSNDVIWDDQGCRGSVDFEKSYERSRFLILSLSAL